MVSDTFFDMGIFIIYFLIWNTLFTCLYSIMKVDPGTFDGEGDQPVDYPGLNRYIALFIMSFRNAIGDLTLPEYGFWVTEVN